MVKWSLQESETLELPEPPTLGGILLCKEGLLRKAPGEAVNKGEPTAVGLCLDVMTGMAAGPAAMAGGLGELDGMEMLKERGVAAAAAPPEWATV